MWSRPSSPSSPLQDPARFRFLERIRTSGHSTLEAWQDEELRRVVMVKRLSPECAAQPEIRERFEAEARMLAGLEHRAIVPVDDASAPGSPDPCYLMPRLEGRPLAAAAHRLEPAALLRIAQRIAEALDYAHDRGVLHCAVSMESIFVDLTGAPILLHWGEARVSAPGESSWPVAAAGVTEGELPVAPELAAGLPPTRATDVHGLGASLRAALLARPGARLPRRLAAILDRATATDPAARYQTAGALGRDLDRYQAGDAIAALPDTIASRLWRRLRRRPRTVVVALALLAATLAIATVAASRAALMEQKRQASYAVSLESAVHVRNHRVESELRAAISDYQQALDSAGSDEEREVAARGMAMLRMRLAEQALAAAVQRGDTIEPVVEALEQLELARGLLPAGPTPERLERLAAEALGVARVTIATEPSGGRVQVLDLPAGALEPGGRAADLVDGGTISLRFGGYLLVASAPGRSETRLPLLLERGFEGNRAITIPLVDPGPPGFVHVPPGWFRSGEDAERRRIETGFHIAIHELTWREYCEFLADRDVDRARHEPWIELEGELVAALSTPLSAPDRPVTGVSHDSAVAYCEWRSARDPEFEFRLPTALELEWASRGADGRSYPWGERFEAGRTDADHPEAIFDPSRLLAPAPGGPPTPGLFGLVETSGSLREWTSTPAGALGFVLLGGYWGSNHLEAQTWVRSREPAGLHSATCGIRLVAVRR